MKHAMRSLAKVLLTLTVTLFCESKLAFAEDAVATDTSAGPNTIAEPVFSGIGGTASTAASAASAGAAGGCGTVSAEEKQATQALQTKVAEQNKEALEQLLTHLQTFNAPGKYDGQDGRPPAITEPQLQGLRNQLESCQRRITEKTDSCFKLFNDSLSYADAEMCSVERRLTEMKTKQKTSINPFSGAFESRNMMKLSTQIVADLTLAQNTCGACMGKGGVGKCGTADAEKTFICTNACSPNFVPQVETLNTNQQFDAYNAAKSFIKFTEEQCANLYEGNTDSIVNKFVLAKKNAADLAVSSGKTWVSLRNKTLIAGGVAAVGGGYMIKKKMDEKEKEKEKDKKIQINFNNGIVKGSDGKDLDCKSTNTYLKAECKESLKIFCAKEENMDKGGCIAFQSNLCSGAENSSSFCNFVAAKGYCKNGGVGAAQSPSCQWVGSRSASCAKNPKDLSCLPKFTATDLDKVCITYNTDPICQKHQAGKLLSQPNANNISDSDKQNSVTSGSASLSSILNKQNATTTSNLWKSNSQAVKDLCKKGKLLNCE